MLRVAVCVEGEAGWLFGCEGVWVAGSKKANWWMDGSWSKPSRRLVRVVTAPVKGLSKRVWRSERVVAQGLAELMTGGLIGGRGILEDV